MFTSPVGFRSLLSKLNVPWCFLISSLTLHWISGGASGKMSKLVAKSEEGSISDSGTSAVLGPISSSSSSQPREGFVFPQSWDSLSMKAAIFLASAFALTEGSSSQEHGFRATPSTSPGWIMQGWGEKLATGICATPFPSALMKVKGAQRADTSGVVTNKCSTIHSPSRSKGPDTCTKELLYVGIHTLAAAQTRGSKVFGWVGLYMPLSPVFLRDAMIAGNSDHSLSPTQLSCSGVTE